MKQQAPCGQELGDVSSAQLALRPYPQEGSYNFLLRRPDFGSEVQPRWRALSERYAAEHGCQCDLRYGAHERNTLDYFPSVGPERGVMIYLHGGYWQRGDKTLYRFLARAYHRQHIGVIFLNYPFCPDVALEEIITHVREGFMWLYRHAFRLGIRTEHFAVMGHSAGAQLAAELLRTDWSRCAPDMPQAPIRCAILVSGIFDLRPLRECSESLLLRLDGDTAHRVSPVLHICQSPRLPKQLILYGQKETAAMHWQSQHYQQALALAGHPADIYEVPNCDHFDIVDALADARSVVFSRTIQLMTE